MSSRSVILALLVAAVLALLTVGSFLLPGTSPATTITSGTALGLQTGDVTAFSIAPNPVETNGISLSRTPSATVPDAWTLKNRNHAFPAEPARVRAALAILASTTAMGTMPALTADEAAQSMKGTTVRLYHTEHRITTLIFGPRGVGGTVKLMITGPDAVTSPRTTPPRFAIVSADLESMFHPEAVLTWRLARPLSELVASPSRVRVIMPAGSIALARTGGSWSLVEPVTAPADGDMVTRLLKALDLVTIARHFDDGPPAAAKDALASPQARLIIERDVPASPPGDPKPTPATTITRELRLGTTPADPDRKTMFATLDDTDFVYAVEAAPLLGLTIDPARYVSATAVSLPAGEIGGLSLQLATASTPEGTQRVTFRRTIEGWTEQRGTGQQVLLTRERGKDVEEALAALTTTRASSVTLSKPQPAAPLAAITLTNLSGEPLAVLDIVAANGGGSNIFIGPGSTPPASGAPGELITTPPNAPAAGSPAIWRAYPKLSPLLDYLLTPALEPAAAILRDAAPAKPATPGIIDQNK